MLSADEVVRFLEAVSSLKARIALTTAYAAGLRVSEVTGTEGGRHRQRAAWSSGSNAARAARSVTSCCPGTVARHPAQLLAACAARTIFSVSGPRQSKGRSSRPCCTPPVVRPRVAAGIDKRVSVHVFCVQLRHPSPGERRRHSHHPGLARPREFVDDGALHARLPSQVIARTESPLDRLSLQVTPPE